MYIFLSLAILMFLISGMPVYMGLSSATLLAFNLEEPLDVTFFISTMKLTDNALFSAIPLFTFTGFILSSSKAPQRLINLTKALSGDFKGSIIIISILSITFLTALTGASGITIVALGPLLLPVMINNGYSEKDSTGLLISSGGLGLLFPPSLPLILYAIVARLDIDTLFKASLLPGVMAIIGLFIFTVFFRKNALHATQERLTLKERIVVVFRNSLEIPLPLIIITGIFSGIINISESAVISLCYVLLIQLYLKEIDLRKKLPGIFLDSMILTGSILIILAAALSFTDFIVDSMIAEKIINFFITHIKSPYLFLLFINILLLIAGCIIDIFSAIIILIPLINPIAQEIGINPYHLAVVFLTNLEIGYSTPPVGLNLFIGSQTFKKSVIEIYKSTLPYIMFMIVILIIITYLPFLSTFLI